MDSEELALWIAADRVEPFENSWVTSAKLIMTLYACHGARIKAQDVYPHLRPPETDWDTLARHYEVWAAGINAGYERGVVVGADRQN
jgi:hypothetical protein